MPTTNETMLEKTFSDLAYNHLRDKAPTLLDYLVGFEMLKSEDDGKRAVGIFGFEIDKDYYYSPIFFLNGEIRGLDSVYSEKSDLFVPLNEDWVDTLVNKRQVRLGETDTRSRQERGINVPNYARLKVIPGGGGGVNLKLAESMKSVRADNFDKVSAIEGLQTVGAINFFKTALDKNPKLLEAFSAFYDLNDLVEPAQKVAEDKSEPVTVITSYTDEGVDSLNDEQRKTIIEGGEVVLDKRPEGTKSILYHSEAKRVLENPTGGSIYDLLLSDGSVQEALIAPNGDPNGNVFVYIPEDKRYGTFAPQSVLTRRKYTNKQFEQWLTDNGDVPSAVRISLPETKDNDLITPPISMDGGVVFVSRSGEASGIFHITKKFKGMDGSTVLDVTPVRSCSFTWDRPSGVPSDIDHQAPAERAYGISTVSKPRSVAYGRTAELPRSGSGKLDRNQRITQIVITPKGGHQLIYTANKLVVNDEQFYVIKLPSDYKKQLEVRDLGDYNTVIRQLDKIASPLKVWSTDYEINLKDQAGVHSYHKTAALKHIMVNYDLGESDARLIIDSAAREPITYKIVKSAAQMLNLPEQQDKSFGNEMTAFHQTQIPWSSVNQAASVDNREFYRYNSPYGTSAAQDEGDTFSDIEQASKSGQKEVFDASVLASLIKTHAPTEQVDRFLPTISAGMDRLGRILFLIYWHYDEFEERYGEDDLLELIDDLRSTFNSVGDAVMFFKKRTLAGDPEHYGLGIDISDKA